MEGVSRSWRAVAVLGEAVRIISCVDGVVRIDQKAVSAGTLLFIKKKIINKLLIHTKHRLISKPLNGVKEARYKRLHTV